MSGVNVSPGNNLCLSENSDKHRLQKGEHFTVAMTERQADLTKRLMIFKDYGKDALLLAVLSYNVGVGRLLGFGKHPKSRLLRKIESGDRNFYRELVSFCRYKGKVMRGLVKRRKVEFTLFMYPDYQIRLLRQFYAPQGAFLGLTFLMLTALAYKGELEPQSAKQNVRSNSQFLYERVQSSWFLHFVLYVHSLTEEFSALIQTCV